MICIDVLHEHNKQWKAATQLPSHNSVVGSAVPTAVPPIEDIIVSAKCELLEMLNSNRNRVSNSNHPQHVLIALDQASDQTG